MAVTPLSPAQHTSRPPSQAVQALESNLGILASIAGLNMVRAQLSISEWLLVGSCIQAVILLLAHYTSQPLVSALTPTFALAAYKLIRLSLVLAGVLENHHMKNVHVGRHTALFPDESGSFERAPGETINGGGMCLILLSTKCNHSLGLLYPPYVKLFDYAAAMFADLETHSDEYGFLGYSNYNGSDTTTKPILMSIMYFRSLTHLHKFSQSKSHRAGWDWWNAAGDGVREIAIAHEVYEVPDGRWENIYQNAPLFDFAATRHRILGEGGERKWVCPALDAKMGFRSADERLGVAGKEGL